jgi:hypothetical protein
MKGEIEMTVNPPAGFEDDFKKGDLRAIAIAAGREIAPLFRPLFPLTFSITNALTSYQYFCLFLFWRKSQRIIDLWKNEEIVSKYLAV